MKRIGLILQEKGIQLENLSYRFCSRIQNLNLENSMDFNLPMNEWSDLKEKLPFYTPYLFTCWFDNSFLSVVLYTFFSILDSH